MMMITHLPVAASSATGLCVLRNLVIGLDVRCVRDGWKVSWPTSSLTPGGCCSIVEASHIEWLLERGFARQLEMGRSLGVTCRGSEFVVKIARQIDLARLDFAETSERDLRALAAMVRAKMPDHDNFSRGQVVANHLLDRLFGVCWLRQFVAGEEAQSEFLRTGSGRSEAEITIGGIRHIHLAEMLWNLRKVEGIENCIQQIETNDIESGFAELEVCKLLTVNDVPYRIVSRTGEIQKDFDLAIDFGGVTACADTKCKLESTRISESTIKDSIKSAAHQMPRDRPCVVFISVPMKWLGHEDDGALGRILKNAANDYLRQTGRIVSVKFHVSDIVDPDGTPSPIMRMLEVNNMNHRFDRNIDWSIYRERSDMPSNWISILRECSDDEAG